MIIIGGANSSKEENHPITNHFLVRNIATCVFEGPGQSEYVLHGGEPHTAARYNEAVQGVIDYLIATGHVDAERISNQGSDSHGGVVAPSVLWPAAADWLSDRFGVTSAPGEYTYRVARAVHPTSERARFRANDTRPSRGYVGARRA